MFTKIYWIHQFENAARLGIMARPRGEDWLAGEITNLKRQQAGVLVSLLENDEISELGLGLQETICQNNGMDFIHFPIPDRDVPTSGEKTDRLVERLWDILHAGTSVVIHCRMGIGRSSIIAASVLLRTGMKANDIIENIAKIRGLKVPDTERQLQWLRARL